MLATAYDGSGRPAPLAQRHVDAYYARRATGDGDMFLPPEMLDLVEDKPSKAPSFDPFELFFYQCKHSPEIGPNTMTVSDEQTVLDNKYEHGLFGVKEVEILEDYLDFGACLRSDAITAKTVRVINRTKGKVSCCWHTHAEEK